jgi:hypothetical protein
MKLSHPFLMIMLLIPFLVACNTVVELLTFNGPANDGQTAEAAEPASTGEETTLAPTATATPQPTPEPTATLEPTPTMAFDLPEPGHQLLLSETLAQGEKHYYHFVATDLGTITAVVTPLDGFDVVLEIVDESDELLLQVDESFGEERLIFTGPEALGRYTLLVRGFEDEAGAYRLNLETNSGVTLFLVDGDEVLSLLGEASRLEYAVTLNVGETVTAVALPDPDLDLSLEIYDIYEDLLLSINAGGPGEAETLTYTALASGVYFLVGRAPLGSIGQFTLALTID